MPFRSPVSAAVGIIICIAGCSEEPRGGPRVPTSPLTGIVLVDDKPTAMVQVKCTATGAKSVPTEISAFTDESGRFSVGTYESGDGAPPGEYKLTFVWGQYGMSGRYEGPDKLGGKYSDANQSEIIAVVKEGEPCDLGEIRLKSGKR